MTAKYLFICGCPRSGTSLLSALIGNISGVGIVQDLCLMFYLKKAALQIMLEVDGVPEEQTPLLAVNMAPTFDLRPTEFFMQYLSCNVEKALNSYSEIEGRLLRRHISFMDYFLFGALNSPDPRKDRGQGAEYLRKINFDKVLDCDSIASALLEVLKMSACPLCSDEAGAVDIICDKTPENLVALDLIDACFVNSGFRFIHLVRDPVSVYGARRQRMGDSVKNFVAFFKLYSEPYLQCANCEARATVRYEDLLNQPLLELKRVFCELGISMDRSFDALLGPIRPGKYVNYVGTGIDVGRDLANRSMVSDAEKSYIYEELSDFCERYSYGKFAAS